MSKLITLRYEFVSYDDTMGVLAPANQLPPTYPPVLDTYTYGTRASAGSSYGVFNLVASGNTTISVPPGATLIVTAPSTNTQFVYIQVPTAVPTQPGIATTAQPIIACGPGQTVTYPGVLNPLLTPLLVRACDQNLAAATTPSITCTIMWSL